MGRNLLTHTECAFVACSGPVYQVMACYRKELTWWVGRLDSTWRPMVSNIQQQIRAASVKENSHLPNRSHDLAPNSCGLPPWFFWRLVSDFRKYPGLLDILSSRASWMAAWASYKDCFCTASISGYLINKSVRNTYVLYVLKSVALQGTVPFSVVQQARWSNLSLILEGLSQHVLDRRIPGDTKQTSAYCWFGFHPLVYVLPRH